MPDGEKSCWEGAWARALGSWSMLFRSPASQKLAKALERRDWRQARRAMTRHPVARWQWLPGNRHILEELLSFDQQSAHELALVALHRGARRPLSSDPSLVGLALKATPLWLVLALLKGLAEADEALDGHVAQEGAKRTSLSVALRRGQWACAERLLDLGADPKVRDADGATAVMALVEGERHLESIRRYADWAEGELKDNVLREKGTLTALLERLLDAGVSLEEVDDQGQNALALACSARRLDLVEKGAALRGPGAPAVAWSALTHGDLGFLERIAQQNPDALQQTWHAGRPLAWAWWNISVPSVGERAIGILKACGAWAVGLEAVDIEGQNFLCAGLANASGSGTLLDWQMARLESELPETWWTAVSTTGQSPHAWLLAHGRSDLVERYVLPRRQVWLEQRLRPSLPRPTRDRVRL